MGARLSLVTPSAAHMAPGRDPEPRPNVCLVESGHFTLRGQTGSYAWLISSETKEADENGRQRKQHEHQTAHHVIAEVETKEREGKAYHPRDDEAVADGCNSRELVWFSGHAAKSNDALNVCNGWKADIARRWSLRHHPTHEAASHDTSLAYVACLCPCGATGVCCAARARLGGLSALGKMGRLAIPRSHCRGLAGSRDRHYLNVRNGWKADISLFRLVG